MNGSLNMETDTTLLHSHSGLLTVKALIVVRHLPMWLTWAASTILNDSKLL